jgi:hypothetical protein
VGEGSVFSLTFPGIPAGGPVPVPALGNGADGARRGFLT